MKVQIRRDFLFTEYGVLNLLAIPRPLMKQNKPTFKHLKPRDT
jgi:hypothetical protein